MPSLLELSIPSLIVGLAYIGATRSEHTLAIVVSMGAALGGFFMLYFFSVMEKFPVVLPQPQPQQPQQPQSQQQPQPQTPQPTLEQLFGAEEAATDAATMQEVTTDDIPCVPEATQEHRPHRRKIVIREYYDEKSCATRKLEKKIQDKLEKIHANSTHRFTAAESLRQAKRHSLEKLLSDLRTNPGSEEYIRRQVEGLTV